jgi:hypothetical protein
VIILGQATFADQTVCIYSITSDLQEVRWSYVSDSWNLTKSQHEDEGDWLAWLRTRLRKDDIVRKRKLVPDRSHVNLAICIVRGISYERCIERCR